MFKIGNSKELPAIPDFLSREAKEFVRLCLQRDPAHRPTAAQLLEHPFVQDATRICRPDDTLAGIADLPPSSPAMRPVVSDLHNSRAVCEAYSHVFPSYGRACNNVIGQLE